MRTFEMLFLYVSRRSWMTSSSTQLKVSVNVFIGEYRY